MAAANQNPNQEGGGLHRAWQKFENVLQRLLSNRQAEEERELNVLLDAISIYKPAILKLGFMVVKADNNTQKSKTGQCIFSLRDLSIGAPYVTSKDTPLIRNSQYKVTLGDVAGTQGTGKIVISVPDQDAPEEEQNKPLMRGLLLPEVLCLFVENVLGRKLDKGLPLINIVNNDQICISTFDDLEYRKKYKTSDRSFTLMALPTGRVEFTFDSRAVSQAVGPSRFHNSVQGIRAPHKTVASASASLNNSLNNHGRPVDIDDQAPNSKRIRLDENGAFQDTSSSSSSSSSIPVPPPFMSINGAPPPPPVPPPPMPNSSGGIPSRKRLRPLRWSTLPSNKLEASVWTRGNDECSSPTPSLIRESELESLFSLSPIATPTKSTSSRSALFQSNGNENTVVSLLSIKRSNNISIVLSRFKSWTDDEIAEAILTRPDTRCQLSYEQLYALQMIMPLSEDVEKVLPYNGPLERLDRPERFLLSINRVPRYEKKIDCLLMGFQYDPTVDELIESLETVFVACEQIVRSERLPRLLKTILALGSVLNRDSYLKARGFRLESLSRLGETKAKKGAGLPTLLHYLAKVVHENSPALLDLDQDIPTCGKAASLSLETLVSEIHSVRQNLEVLISECHACALVVCPASIPFLPSVPLDAHSITPAVLSALSSAVLSSSVADNGSMSEVHFFRNITQCLINALPRFQHLVHSLSRAQSNYVQICNYFGEETQGELISTKFFGVIHHFADSLKNAHQQNVSSGALCKRDTSEAESLLSP